MALAAVAGRDAGLVHAAVWAGGAAIRGRLRHRKVSGERAVHRGQPAEVAGADRTATGKPEVVRRDDRWHRL